MTDRYENIRRALQAKAGCDPDTIRELLAERDRLAAKQPAAHPAITHCDSCGCDWLDNGLNPVGCPYCKESPAIGEEIMVNAAHGVFTLPLPKPSVPLPKPSVPLPKIGDQYFAAPQQPAPEEG